MNRALKWTLIGAGSLIALLVAALILAATLIDPNAYKPEIVQAVKDKTGRKLTFEGDLKLSVFPWIGVDIGGVEMGNAPGFGAKPFVKVGRTSVRLRLLPLLFGQVRLGTISVEGLTLNLAVNEQGVSNWQDLAGPEEPKKEERPDKPGKGEFDLAIGGLDVTNANIDYDNRQGKKHYSLRNARIALGSFSPGSPFDFEIAFGVEISDPQLAAQNTLSGTASLDLAARRYELKGLKATIIATGKAVPGGKADVALGVATLKADIVKQTLSLDGLSLATLGLTATGTIEGARIMDAPEFKGSLTVGPCSARQALAALGQKPLDTADPKALDKVSATLDFSYGPDLIETPAAVLKLDETTINLRLRMTGSGKPAYAINAKIDALDVDRYLPPRKEGETAAQKDAERKEAAEAAGQPEKDVIPVKTLRELNLDAELSVASLKVRGAQIKDLLVMIRAADGIVDVKPAQLALYGGSISAAASMNLQGEQPRTQVAAWISDLAAGPLVKDMTGKENFAGLVNVTTALTCLGAKVSTMKRTLNGDLSFHIKDGVFPGVNLSDMALAAAKSRDKSGKVESKKEDQTRFGEISGTATVTDGLIQNKDLDVKAPHIRASGEGQVDLNTETIDYLVKARVVASGEGQGASGGGLGEIIGLTVPIRVSGTFKNPSYWVDLTEYVKMLGQAAIGAVGGVVEGVGSLFKGGKKAGEPKAGATGAAPKKEEKKGGLLDGVKKLF